MSDNLIDLEAWRRETGPRTVGMRRTNRNEESHARTRPLQIDEAEFERYLGSTPAEEPLEIVAKAKYLIQLFATTAVGREPHRQTLIASTLEEIDRLFD
ncbi:MAG: hypothetical protein RLN70_00020 [Rhodospirillaceae bacterium]